MGGIPQIVETIFISEVSEHELDIYTLNVRSPLYRADCSSSMEKGISAVFVEKEIDDSPHGFLIQWKHV